jgi:hypothetical protein
VVAKEEVNLDAAVGQLGQFAKEACVSPGDEVAIGEPEVEDVAEKNECFTLWHYLVKETTELTLTVKGVFAASQMCIRYKKNAISQF